MACVKGTAPIVTDESNFQMCNLISGVGIASPMRYPLVCRYAQEHHNPHGCSNSIVKFYVAQIIPSPIRRFERLKRENTFQAY